jgi:hypothetical protein
MTTMIEVKTADLIGPALDWAVARLEGWKWARNACGRSGDSFARYHDSKAKPRWPIGSLCFVEPGKSKDLTSENKNWDGWLLPRGGEPLAPAAFDSVPCFSTIWAHGGPLIEKYRIAYLIDGKGYCAIPHESDYGGWGATHLIAACRAIVAAKLGDAVSVPAELVQP